MKEKRLLFFVDCACFCACGGCAEGRRTAHLMLCLAPINEFEADFKNSFWKMERIELHKALCGIEFARAIRKEAMTEITSS